MQTIATFATNMRASSLIEDLTKAGITACITQPKWTNKKLPPPKVEVSVPEVDIERANVVLNQFKGVK